MTEDVVVVAVAVLLPARDEMHFNLSAVEVNVLWVATRAFPLPKGARHEFD